MWLMTANATCNAGKEMNGIKNNLNYKVQIENQSFIKFYTKNHIKLFLTRVYHNAS